MLAEEEENAEEIEDEDEPYSPYPLHPGDDSNSFDYEPSASLRTPPYEAEDDLREEHREPVVSFSGKISEDLKF